MKIRTILLSAAVAASLLAGAQQINPITKAMLDGYNEWLAKNPNDYQTLYERGAQYYQLGMLDNAYIDIVKAIDNTPAKDQDARARSFALLSDILSGQKNYQKALEAIDKALEVAPTSYPNMYKKGEICLALNKPQEAYAAFSQLQRLKTRSQEAFFGMAKAKAMQGDMEEAKELIKEVEQSDPTNFVTYYRIGDFYKSIKQDNEAAANYLMAFSLTDNSPLPMNALINLGKENYPAVSNAINYAMGKTKNTVPLYFLNANIAYRSGNFDDAYAAYKSLMATKDGNDPDILAGMASTCLALDKIPEAQTAVNGALQMANDADIWLLKSQIERAAKLPSAALTSAQKSVELSNGATDALVEAALANIELKQYEQALKLLNEAVINNADNPLPMMLRAFVYKAGLKDEKKAVADYTRVANVPYDTYPEIIYGALAKTLSGKKIDGDAIVETAITKNSGKEAAYWTAVYYAQTGNLEKARQWRDKAVELGYNNKRNLESNADANLNLSPIKHLK